MAKKPTYEELEQRVKEFDKEVQETKRRLEDIIETALFGIYELDNSGKFTYVSEYYCEMIGYEKKELIGEQFTKIIHEDDLSLTHNIFTRILQGESIRDTIKLKHGKGHFIHVSYITKTIYNEKGEAVGFRGSAEDISGRKQAEEALHQQNEYLLALHEISLGLINRLDMNELLEAIIERAALLAGTENGFIYLLDPGETEIKMRVGIGIYADLVGYMAKLGDGLAGEVWKTAQPLLVDDYYSWEGRLSDKGLDVFHSSVGIPLKSGRQVVGVIGLAHVEEEGEKFTEKNVTVLSRFAELASIALDNARLYEDIRRELAERKRVEKALRESEERYRTITENTNEAILVAQDGVFRFANPKAEELFGYSKEELASRPFADFIHEADRGMVGDRHERRVRGEELPATYPYRIVDKGGHTKWIELNVALFSWAERPATLCFMMDITNRKLAEEALRESEEKYRITLQSIPDSVCINRQKDGLYFYANDGFSQLSGYSREDTEGKTPNDLNLFVNPVDRDEFIKILKEKKEVDGFELQYRKKDGTIFDALLSARPLNYGEEDCLVTVVKDITPIKKAEQEKAKLRAQLQHAQRMESIGTLAGGLAHNFNNLLMSIIGNASLILLDLNPDHPHYKNLKNIEKSVKSGSQVTRQLLGYAREGRYEVKPISLNQSVKETSDTFGLTRKEIRVHQELDENLYGINADQGQIEQVLMNLYVNAADAMPKGGDLFLNTMNVTHREITDKQYDPKPGNYILLTVRDTGVGMDEKTMERIFDPFFTTKGLAEGTGLGLASAYGIVKAHGGYIDVDSEKGHGTTFEIYLLASEEEVTEEKISTDEIIKGKGTVLLVDDEEMVLDAGEQMLRKLGYEVLLAGSGQEALEQYKKNQDRIDMILLDMVMPGMGGGKTYDRLKEINPKVMVLLSSGYSIDGQAKEILKRGCDGFIQKPFSLEQLSQRIRILLVKK